MVHSSCCNGKRLHRNTEAVNINFGDGGMRCQFISVEMLEGCKVMMLGIYFDFFLSVFRTFLTFGLKKLALSHNCIIFVFCFKVKFNFSL